MKVLVACEESQIVTKAFRKLGIEAYSCDIQDCSGGHPEWHIKGDAIREAYSGKYDLMIAHPPCTYLSVSGARWYYHPKDKHLPTDQRRPHPRFPNRLNHRDQAIDFFLILANSPIKHIAIENPISIMSSHYRKPNQIIQPWQFGHGETKKTCLWLKNLPKLSPTQVVPGRENKIWKMPPSKDRSKLRSKTFKGIAQAMATQWGIPVAKKNNYTRSN